MTIQFPPIEPCRSVVWARFAQWMATMMARDAGPVSSIPDYLHSPLFDVKFRGLSFRYCPFCGAVLDPTKPIESRHPQ